jgi:hypothetical protein
MPFDTGSGSFRIFHLPKEHDRSIVGRFAARAAPPIGALVRDPIRGWVTGRHLLDRAITEESCLSGGYVHVQLMQAERKIPEALLRATCKLEEQAEMQARDTVVLPRQVRAEIKARVIEDLLPGMPPTLTGMPAVVDLRNNLLLASAMSDKGIDRFTGAFRDTTGDTPILLTPATLAVQRRQLDARNLAPTSFSPDPEVMAPGEADLGMEFLTWLWHRLETEGGDVELDDGTQYGLLMEGPVVFFGAPADDGSDAGSGALETVLRKGAPLASREAGTAVVCGKQLRRVKINVANDNRLWSLALDSEFAFRSLKLPKCEPVDPVGCFQERMLAIEELWSLLFALYDGFLEERADAAQWDGKVAAMREWAAERAG